MLGFWHLGNKFNDSGLDVKKFGIICWSGFSFVNFVSLYDLIFLIVFLFFGYHSDSFTLELESPGR